ncbi:MAG TPA: S41 family peptidase, partial [Minicystis sp.]|nr:S41 family peptidase [Minicystis sp.]
MLPASNSGVGMNLGFPDVCVTPVGPVPTPIPYPNLAMNATAVPFAPNVLVSFVPALNMGATIPMTLGDQAGTLSPFMGPGLYTMGNPIVMVNALPAISLLCPTTGNNMINALGAVLVPSITNVFYSDRDAPARGGVTPEALAAFAARASGASVRASRGASGVAVVAVRLFAPGTAAAVYDAVRRLGDVAALVVDVRGCPGGELVEAIQLAGDFLDDGDVVVTATDGDGDETVHRARGARLYAFPVAVLVDGGTASAAEVFAGCLKAHRRAFVVGERTFGKLSAQALVPGVDAPGARYETLASLALPGSEPLAARGVVPDVDAGGEDAVEAACAALRFWKAVPNDEVIR